MIVYKRRRWFQYVFFNRLFTWSILSRLRFFCNKFYLPIFPRASRCFYQKSAGSFRVFDAFTILLLVRSFSILLASRFHAFSSFQVFGWLCIFLSWSAVWFVRVVRRKWKIVLMRFLVDDFCDKRSEEHTLNSSHITISYAVFCFKKKKKTQQTKNKQN